MPPLALPRWLKLAGLAAATLLAFNAGLAWRREKATERVVTLREQIRVTDTLYARDTLRATQWRTVYRERRDTLLQHDTTTRVRETVAACDSALASDSSARTTGERRVAIRDTLIREIARAAAPKSVQLYAEGGVGWQWQDPILRGGVSLQTPIPRTRLVAEVAHRLDDRHTTARALVRVEF